MHEPGAPAADRWAEAIVAQAAEAVNAVDRDGVIRLWNRGAEALFGYTAAEALGQGLDLIVPERFRAAHWSGFRHALGSGRTTGGNRVRTTRSLHKDGRKLYVELSFGLLYDRSGGVAGAFAIGRDGTARHAAVAGAAVTAAPPQEGPSGGADGPPAGAPL
jgi:PAS domain S-box-containing protein